MEIKLRSDLEEFVLSKVKNGYFASAEDVIQAALDGYREAEEELRRELAEGIADVEAGRVADWDVNEVKEEILRYTAGKKAV